MRTITPGATDQSIRLWVYDSSGNAITGQVYNSAGIAVSVVVRSAGRIVSTTALTLVARSGTGVHTDSAFTEVGSGEYVVDLADSYAATANRQVSVTFTSTAASGGYVVSEVLDVQTASLTTLGANAPAGWINAAAIDADAITAAKIAADAVTEIQSGLATLANQTLILDRCGYLMAQEIGACSTAATATETYAITIDATTYTIAHTGLTEAGNRGTATLTKT